jgi:hypothetical protein
LHPRGNGLDGPAPHYAIPYQSSHFIGGLFHLASGCPIANLRYNVNELFYRKYEIFCLPLFWTFRYYVGNGNSLGVKDVFETSKQLQARFRSKLLILAQLEITDWREPLFKVLVDQDGISEIRFKADNVEQRPLGFWSGEAEYTLLLWATEKNNRFIPKNACVTAKARKAACMADRRLSHDLWFALQ